jgi:acyl-CoA synthetase
MTRPLTLFVGFRTTMAHPMFDQALIDSYVAAGWWGTETLGDVVARHAASRPDAPAYIVVDGDPPAVLTWARYHECSWQLAAVFAQAGLEPGDRLGVVLPDGATVHAVFLAAEKAGLVVVGIGARAGPAELRHLLTRTGALALVTHADLLGRPAGELVTSLRVDSVPGLRHIVVPDVVDFPGSPVLVDGSPVESTDVPEAASLLTGRVLGPDDLFMINSTSGTTGLPKCVLHTENRWFYFHRLAVEAGALTSDDVFFGAVPAPFGFGLWTAHFSPGVLGCPTVVAAKFGVERTLRAVVAHRVSVLACVSTQFIMMLNSPLFDELDLSSLRVMFTGGEAVPFARAAAFEDRTGATVLQFYGSNETGVLSGTRLTDSRERRFGTAGRVIDAMAVRVYDDQGTLMTGSPLVGIPACKGPATCVGYLDDDEANAQLFTDGGWMLMGDVVEIDGDGYLRVIGRTSDIIIRGGKNISAPALEAEIAEHPDVDLVAAVSMPDETFGERVCVYVCTKDGVPITLSDVTAFLAARGVGREQFPERLIQLDALPRSSGGKVAKGELRADIRTRLAAE